MLLTIFSGPGVKQFFSLESGNHTWSRIPPTETKGRVHTSSVTVVVLDDIPKEKVQLNPREIEITTTRGTGNGGQHKNTTDSCVVAKHIATNISVRRDGRCQHKNKADAMRELSSRVQQFYNSKSDSKVQGKRREQVGSGNRAEKIRTYNVKADRATDHMSGKKTSLNKIYRGNLRLLH